MWRFVDLACAFLHVVSIASLWSVVHAQSGADGPCNTCPVECIGRQCARYWWTTMWGFIVTLVALTVDAWGSAKSVGEGTIFTVSWTVFWSVLNPLLIVWWMLDGALKGMAMLDNLRDVLGDDVIAPLYPWSKSRIKLTMASNIFVNLSPDVYKEVGDFNTCNYISVEDFPEALVIGTKVEDSGRYNVGLTDYGKLALLRSNVLPPYDQLKFLRGSSSLGMAIAAAQAIGYIYGIVVRCVQGLRVSPVEAIACLLNIVVLMKVVLHNFASVAHRPLLQYLLPEQEAKFISECRSVNESFEFKTASRLRFAILISIVSLLAVVSYFIFNFIKSLKVICIVPIIIFELTLVLGGVQRILGFDYFIPTVFLIVMLNLVGYVWALFVTFKYWKAEEFDVRSSNYLSQMLPYIG